MRKLTLIHGSSGHGRQWRGLLAHVPGQWDVQTPTLAGYDEPLDPHHRYSLDTELIHIAPAIQSPTVLVAHSLGAVVSVAAAIRWRARVQALVLVEPVLFQLFELPGYSVERQRVRAHLRKFVETVADGHYEEAALSFFRFWSMESAWESMDSVRRAAIVRTMPKVALECRLLETQALPPNAIASLQGLPTLVVSGGSCTPLMDSMTRALARLWPSAQHAQVPGAGHLLPATHPGELADRLIRFLDKARTFN